MKNINNRRRFIKNATITGLGLGLAAHTYGFDKGPGKVSKGKRIGMIGLDTGHSVAFTKSLNDPMAGDKYNGYNPLLVKITEFFDSGTIPVPIEETLEIFAFMEAAEESKKRGGASVEIKSVIEDAKS